MLGAALTLVLAAVLATSAAPVPDVPAAQAPPIRMTTVNWGHPVSVLDAAHPAWSHLAPLAGPTQITATIELRGVLVHSWAAHLDAPRAYGGAQPEDCRGSEEAAPAELSCVFEVPVSSGSNPLTVTFSADGRVLGDATGAVRGGELAWDAGFEVLDATGHWTAIVRDHAVDLPATASTALREVVTNTGTIPLRLDGADRSAAVPGAAAAGSGSAAPSVDAAGAGASVDANAASCNSRILAPREHLVCPLRGVRPARTLAGDLRRELRVIDAVGGIAEFEIRGGITTFPGTFSLSRANAVVGQALVVRARGLPTDQAFAVQYRLDDQATLLGTSITRSGSLDYGFVVPGSSPGTVRLNVVHDGITIASIPFEVTRVPIQPDAATPPWGLVAIPLVVLVGLLVAWRLRRRALGRARARVTATPAPPPTDPSPDATPATPVPEAVRRR